MKFGSFGMNFPRETLSPQKQTLVSHKELYWSEERFRIIIFKGKYFFYNKLVKEIILNKILIGHEIIKKEEYILKVNFKIKIKIPSVRFQV